jgi:ribosomal 30S subunit maturation factor RimM
MIEQIKQALDKEQWTISQNALKWLRYLITEVEAAKGNALLWRDKATIHQREVEEMQKALEWYADEENYDLPEGEYYIATKLDRGYRARQALQSIQGGNIHEIH